MSSPVARAAPRRRTWVDPLLWTVVPALLAVLPWAARQWRNLRPAERAPRGVEVRLSGDRRRDRLALLERAWAEARPQPAPRDLPSAVLDRMARREATWLSEIAAQLLPLDSARAEQAAGEAVGRIGDLPERMGPEDLVVPDETPTGRLLRLARAFATRPAVADRARHAALEQSRNADWPGSRVYALCLIARESATADPPLARAVLREAQAVAGQLPAEERVGALAALAGSSAALEPAAAVQARVTRALASLEKSAPGPVARAVAAALLAPAAPDAAHRLAEAALACAAVPAPPPEDSLPFRGPFGEAPLAVQVVPSLGSGGLTPPPGASPADELKSDEVDSQFRRVAAALAVTHPTLAERAANRIRRPEDRSGSFTEIAALLEARDPARAAALYRRALEAADEIGRPPAARRAARIRAASGLAAFDAPAAAAVMEAFPSRLIAMQVNEFTVRLARRDPERALRLIEQGETALVNPDYPAATPFSGARAAIAEQIARRDPQRAASLLSPAEGRRAIDGWLALARGLAAGVGG